MTTDLSMRLSGDQIYLAFPCLALLALAAVLPPILHSSTYLFIWEAFVTPNAPIVAYAAMIGACVVSAAAAAYMLKLTCGDAEVRILTPPTDDDKWAEPKARPQQPQSGGSSNKVVPVDNDNVFPNYPTGGGQQQQQPQGGYYPGSPGGGTYVPMPPNRVMMMAPAPAAAYGGGYGGGYYASPTAAMAASPRAFERRGGVGSPARYPVVAQAPLPLMDVDPNPAPLPGATWAPQPQAASPPSPGWNRMPKPPGAPLPPAPPPLPPQIGLDLPPGQPLGEGVEETKRSSTPRKPVSPLNSVGRLTDSGDGLPPWAQDIKEIQEADDDDDDDLPVRRRCRYDKRMEPAPDCHPPPPGRRSFPPARSPKPGRTPRRTRSPFPPTSARRACRGK